MDISKHRRVIALGGAAVAVCGGLGVAALVAMRQADEAPPASQGGLMVQAGRDDDVKLDPLRPLRCFVGGRFIGLMPVIDCAKKNGVATGDLDVGIDASGALSATTGPSADIAPLPAPAPPPEDTFAQADKPIAQPAAQVAAVSAETEACWGYGARVWQASPDGMTLNACIQNLFGGQCAHPGVATYGRWGQHMLRLVLGRVEISADNSAFRPLVELHGGCAIPPVR